jgi:uncharacterized membrane protein
MIGLIEKKTGIYESPITKENMPLIIKEEIFFFIAFGIWTFINGFAPAAYGVEKFMNYGYMMSMIRADTLPANDMWYSGYKINYYYGGQYYATFLTRLLFSKPQYVYNIMISFISSTLFIGVYSLVNQMLLDSVNKIQVKERKINVFKKERIASLGGIFAGTIVTMAGNMHYVVYGFINPLLIKLFNLNISKDNVYYYAKSTRYIGCDPLNDTQNLITEFPAYSILLKDLHAHFTNTLFVITFIAVLYSFIKKIYHKVVTNGAISWGYIPKRNQKVKVVNNKNRMIYKEESVNMFRHDMIGVFLCPYILLISFFIAIFQLNNYWDFVIYITVVLVVLVYLNILINKTFFKSLLISIIQTSEIYILSKVMILPFLLKFETMQQGVGITKERTYIHQFIILWGLAIILLFAFIMYLVKLHKSNLQETKITVRIKVLIRNISPTEQFVVIMGICALGLCLIPEVLYVKDIYTTTPRANTGFKLTYQAYIMFQLCSSYIIIRFLNQAERIKKIIGIVSLFLLLVASTYTVFAINQKFNSRLSLDDFEGLDASVCIDKEFYKDSDAINWLNNSIKGSPVVLEANGLSYTAYERVSAMTGLPTVIGWHTHEQLWRNDSSDIYIRENDVATIYTTNDYNVMMDLLHKYQVQYIFVGEYERKLFNSINDNLLKKTGNIAFNGKFGTYIIKVDYSEYQK